MGRSVYTLALIILEFVQSFFIFNNYKMGPSIYSILFDS